MAGIKDETRILREIERDLRRDDRWFPLSSQRVESANSSHVSKLWLAVDSLIARSSRGVPIGSCRWLSG